MSKWCSKCDREQRDEAFARSTATVDGLQPWCCYCKSKANVKTVPKLLAEPISEQECAKCHETLPAGDFSCKVADSPEFGRQVWCKDCMRIYKRERRQAPGLAIFERQQRELNKQDRYEIENARKRGEL